MTEHYSIEGEPCPTGFKKVGRIAHAIPEQLKCSQCGAYHKEVMDAYLRDERALREQEGAVQIKQLAEQMLEEIAENEPDLSVGQARFLAKALALWAFNKGCRP